MQTQMEEKVSVPRRQEAFQNMDEIYAMVSRSRLVQEHVHRIRKSQSADSTISRLENNNEHRALANLRMNRSFGKKAGPEISSLTSGSCMQGDLASPVGAGETGTRRLVESEHVVVDLCAAMQSPDDQILVASRKKNHPEDKLGAAVKGFIMMKEPTFPIYLKFSDVGYKIGNGGRPRTVAMEYILQGVTGSVKPGEILVLMGPSGGGKTTLLNLLSGRLKSKGHGGSITYNGRPYSKSLKRRIGFVLQDDVVFPHLTVRETLTYAALLRLPKTLTKQQKKERVRRIIFDLGLERCQDTIVGGACTRGVSGGERKRVCIGNEILLDPSLLFLDEPTSGLDSTTALRIVQMLHSIAHAGKTVVTTIHQPSSRMFNMFDKLILLGKGSSLYYGKASEAMLYFSSIGCSPLIPMNPAEFLIDLANGNLNDKSVSHEIKCHDTRSPSSADIHRYLLGAYETRLSAEKKQKTLMPPAIDTKWMVQGGACSNESAVSWLEQCYILFCRGLRERRHEYLSYIRVIQIIATAIIIGLLWWHSDSSSPKSLQDQAGLLFFISVFWGYFPVFVAIFTFPKERAMLAKERAVDMYRLSAYFIARTLSDLPLDLILPSVFLLIVYFMAGLRSDFTAFLESVFTVVLSIVAAQGLGLAVGAAMMDIKKATTLASVIIMTFMLAGGFFIQRVPFFMTWIRYLSFNYHAYRLLLKAQYCCAAGESHGCTNPCNSPFIEGLGLDDGGMEIGAMVAMAFGYRLLAYLFLRKMKIQN